MEDSTLIARKIGEATLGHLRPPLAIFSATAPPPRRMNYIMATGSSAICRRPAAERFRFAFTRHGVSTELKTEPHLGINESNAHIAAGEAGLGIVQTFTYSLKPALASGELVEILSAWRRPPILFTLSMPGTGTSRPGSASLLTGWRRFFRAAVQG
ncbi:LysR family transcriptional regulator [Klebsiella pneumoniae subsp. pneumoniae]|nr:LysR family transcriptional regulator [Klebsiella pneumoniae subsp. pneumoniae]